MKSITISAVLALAAIGTPAFALADTAGAAPSDGDRAAATTLVCRAPAANEQHNAMLGSVALICTNAKTSVAVSSKGAIKAVQSDNDRAWLDDIFMLDHDRGGDGGG